MTGTISRFLLHPVQDYALFAKVLGILEDAVAECPDTFDKSMGQPSIIDNYGYHTSTLGATVLVQEPFSRYYRLTIRKGEHSVFDQLAELAVKQLTK